MEETDKVLQTKDIKNYIRVISSVANESWKKAITDFTKNISLGKDILQLNESDCIIRYIHDKSGGNFEIYNYNNATEDFVMSNMTLEEFSELGISPYYLVNPETNVPVTEENIKQYTTPLFRHYLEQIADMSHEPIDSDYFFLVRIIKNKGKVGEELQAEGWHHDYM